MHPELNHDMELRLLLALLSQQRVTQQHVSWLSPSFPLRHFLFTRHVTYLTQNMASLLFLEISIHWNKLCTVLYLSGYYLIVFLLVTAVSLSLTTTLQFVSFSTIDYYFTIHPHNVYNSLQNKIQKSFRCPFDSLRSIYIFFITHWYCLSKVFKESFVKLY